MTIENSIETQTAIQRFDGDCLLRVDLKPGANVDLEQAELSHEATQRLVGDRRVLVLVDARLALNITREARVFFSDSEKRANTIAQAIVVDSGISRVMGNFFIGLNRPEFPVKLFTSIEEAEVWLRGHIR